MKTSKQSTKAWLNLQGGNRAINKVELTKIWLNLQEDNLKNSTTKLLVLESIGFILILSSGILPFAHSFIKHKVLDEKLFGFTSVHTFMYSLGTHLSLLFLVLGVLLSISIISNKEKYETIQRQMRYALLSPFISAVFYLSWIFVPNVNYDILAYIFLGLFISALSVFVYFKIHNNIKALKLIYRHRETVVLTSIDYLKSRLSK